jgi:hypothetical protein
MDGKYINYHDSQKDERKDAKPRWQSLPLCLSASDSGEVPTWDGQLVFSFVLCAMGQDVWVRR